MEGSQYGRVLCSRGLLYLSTGSLCVSITGIVSATFKDKF